MDGLFPSSLRESLDNAASMQLQTLLQRIEKEAIWDSFHLLDCIHARVTSLGSDATQEIHLALWKHIQSLHQEHKHSQVIPWCQLALHSALSNHRPDARAKFTRKMMASHIALGDYADALSLFQASPAPTQDHLLTRFLVFRLAVRGWNQTLARDCLQFFATRNNKDEARDALYACVREAQSAGDRLCAVEALKAAVATWKNEAVVAANVSLLLRCAIRLLQMLATEPTTEDADATDMSKFTSTEMINLFNTAAEFVSQQACDQNGDVVFHAAELRWFSTNAYNLGITHCTSWDPGRLASLFKSCLVFTQALQPSSDNDATNAEPILIILRCHFILASLFISEARIVKNEHTQSLYADVEKHATAFYKLIVKMFDSTLALYPDLGQKHGILCIFQCEALLSRQFYDHIPCIIKQARLCKDVDVFKALGGSVIHSEAPVQGKCTTLTIHGFLDKSHLYLRKMPKVKSSLLKSIVNEIFETENFNSTRLAQYLRCMVQVLLPMVDDAAARELLDQAIQIAKDAKEVGVDFPEEEAQWLVAAAFNHGLTRYAASDDMGSCHIWLDKAMAMAQHADKDGQLLASLEQRRQKLAATSFADIY